MRRARGRCGYSADRTITYVSSSVFTKNGSLDRATSRTVDICPVPDSEGKQPDSCGSQMQHSCKRRRQGHTRFVAGVTFDHSHTWHPPVRGIDGLPECNHFTEDGSGFCELGFDHCMNGAPATSSTHLIYVARSRMKLDFQWIPKIAPKCGQYQRVLRTTSWVQYIR